MKARQAAWYLVLVALGTVVVYPVFRYRPRAEAMAALERELEAKRLTLTDPRSSDDASELTRLQAEFKQVSRSLQDVKSSLTHFQDELATGGSAGPESQNPLLRISQLAANAGVRLRESTAFDGSGPEGDSLSPLAQILSEGPGYGRHLQRVTFDSDYAALRKFVEGLQGLSPEVIVVHFTLETGGGQDSQILTTLVCAL